MPITLDVEDPFKPQRQQSIQLDVPDPFKQTPQAQQPATVTDRLRDVAIFLTKGVIAVPETAVGLAGIPTMGRPGKGLEYVGFKPETWKKSLEEYYSPEQQEANRKVSEAKGFVETARTVLENPSTILHTIAESAPSMIAGGLGAHAIISKFAPKIITPIIAGAIGEGVVSAGQTAEQIRQATDSGLLTPGQSATALGSGAATGLLGVIGGKLAQRLGIADVDTLLAGGVRPDVKKGILKRVVQSALVEGAFEELPQSAQEQVAQNIALKRPFGEGVANAAAQGMLAGMAMGSLGGVLPGQRMGKEKGNADAVRPASTVLPPDFFTGTLYDLESGKSTVNDIVSFRDKYADSPSVDQASLKTLDAFLDELRKVNAPTPTYDSNVKGTVEGEPIGGLAAGFGEGQTGGNILKGQNLIATNRLDQIANDWKARFPQQEPPVTAIANFTIMRDEIANGRLSVQQAIQLSRGKDEGGMYQAIVSGLMKRQIAGPQDAKSFLSGVGKRGIGAITAILERKKANLSFAKTGIEAENLARVNALLGGIYDRQGKGRVDGQVGRGQESGRAVQGPEGRGEEATAGRIFQAQEGQNEVAGAAIPVGKSPLDAFYAKETRKLETPPLTAMDFIRQALQEGMKVPQLVIDEYVVRGGIVPQKITEAGQSKAQGPGELASSPPTSTLASRIDKAANEAATSPLNDLPEPTQAQKEAGNYKVGKVRLQGLDISIENPRGSTRQGTSRTGKQWKTTMQDHYGYITGYEGKDKDKIDVFIGENPESDMVFVINQVDPGTGKLDEHKIMMGYETEEEAQTAYQRNYEKGWKGLGSIVPMSMDQFSEWLEKGDKKKAAKVPKEQPIKTAPSLYSIILKNGGLSPGAIRSTGIDLKEDVQQAGLFGLMRKDGQSPDALATELEGQGIIPPAPENMTPDQWLMKLLQDERKGAAVTIENLEKQADDAILALEEKYGQEIVEARRKEIESSLDEEEARLSDEEAIQLAEDDEFLSEDDYLANPSKYLENKQQEEQKQPAAAAQAPAGELFDTSSTFALSGQQPVNQKTFQPPEKRGERLIESERQSIDELRDRLSEEKPKRETTTKNEPRYSVDSTDKEGIQSTKEESNATLNNQGTERSALHNRNYRSAIARCGEALSGDSRGSIRREDIRIPEGLTEEQRRIADTIESDYDVSVFFFEGIGIAANIRGIVIDHEGKPTIFLNTSSKRIEAVALHELMHSMELKRPDLYKQVLGVVQEQITIQNLERFRDELNKGYERTHTSLIDLDEVQKELVANLAAGQSYGFVKDKETVRAAIEKAINKYGKEGSEKAIEAPEADKGPVVFRKSSDLSTPSFKLTYPPKPRYSPEEVDRFIDPIRKALPNIGEVRVVDSHYFQLLLRYAKAAEEPGKIFGAYDPANDTTYVISDAINDPQSAKVVLLHEVIGHRGINSVLSEGERKLVYRQIYEAYKGSEQADSIIKRYKLDLAKQEDRDTFSAELLAHMAETGEKPGLWKTIVAMIRNALRRLGISLEYTEADIKGLIGRSYAWSREGTQQETQLSEQLREAPAYKEQGPYFKKESPDVPTGLTDWINNSEPLIQAKKNLSSEVPVNKAVIIDQGRSLLQYFKDRFGTGYTDTDMKTYQRVVGLPYWLGKQYKGTKGAVDIEMHAMEQYSSEVFKDYQGDLQDALDTVQKDKKLSREFIDLIWKWEGRPFPEKAVPSSWMKVNDVTRDITINQDHYAQMRSYLEEQGVSPKVINAYVATRRILDEKLLDMWERVKKTKDDEFIRKYRQEMGTIYNYFPHRRAGDSHVTITDRETGDVVYREHYYKLRNRFKNIDQKAMVRAVRWLGEAIANKDVPGKASQYDITEGPVKHLPDEVFFQVPVEAMQQIVTTAAWNLSRAQEASEKVKTASFEAMEKALSKATADVLKSRGFGQHMIQRKGIPGFEKELVYEILFDYLSGYAGFKAKMERAQAHHKNLMEINAKEHPTEYSYTSRYVTDMLTNADRVDRMADTLRGIFFVKYLGGVVKSGIVNLTQNVVMAAPMLSVHTKRAEAKLATAMYDVRRALTSKQAWTGKAVTYPGLTKDEQQAIHELIEQGVTTDLFLRELKGNISATGWLKRTWKVFDKAGIFMQIAEKFNRVSTGLAAYRVARNEKNMPHDEAVKFAEQIVFDSHFLYGKRNLPEIMRGGDLQKLLRTGYTFRQFTHNYLSAMAHLLKHQGVEGKKAFARSLRNLLVIGGLSGIPFFKAFIEALSWAIGDDNDEDPMTKARSYMPANWLKDLVVYGLPGVAGVDITGSIGIEVPTGWKDILGVPYAVGEDFVNTMDSLKAGNNWRALSETPFTPVAIRNAMKGIELYTEGQRTRGGKNINFLGEQGARKINAAEAIAKGALGLQPVSSSKAYAAHEAVQGIKEGISDKKRNWADRYVNAVRRSDEKEKLKIRAEVGAWNQKAREEGKLWRIIDISEMIMSRMREGGLEQIPKNMRREALKMTREWSG